MQRCAQPRALRGTRVYRGAHITIAGHLFVVLRSINLSIGEPWAEITQVVLPPGIGLLVCRDMYDGTSGPAILRFARNTGDQFCTYVPGVMGRIRGDVMLAVL